jgi:hypothetical protein
LLPFEIGAMNARKAGESGLWLKAWVARQFAASMYFFGEQIFKDHQI